MKQAQAQLDQAKLNLGYTKILAPVDGIVTRKSVEINQNVSVGQNLMTLVSLDDIWVTANFKETQLKHMTARQEVEIHVDATGKDYSGKVTQIGGATGSVLSLFPPENATGNYVKVGAAAAGAHRFHEPEGRRREACAAARFERRAEGAGEVKQRKVESKRPALDGEPAFLSGERTKVKPGSVRSGRFGPNPARAAREAVPAGSGPRAASP